jgi:hypothetical protein
MKEYVEKPLAILVLSSNLPVLFRVLLAYLDLEDGASGQLLLGLSDGQLNIVQNAFIGVIATEDGVER